MERFNKFISEDYGWRPLLVETVTTDATNTEMAICYQYNFGAIVA